jgi:hypothetical protein
MRALRPSHLNGRNPYSRHKRSVAATTSGRSRISKSWVSASSASDGPRSMCSASNDCAFRMAWTISSSSVMPTNPAIFMLVSFARKALGDGMLPSFNRGKMDWFRGIGLKRKRSLWR